MSWRRREALIDRELEAIPWATREDVTVYLERSLEWQAAAVADALEDLLASLRERFAPVLRRLGVRNGSR